MWKWNELAWQTQGCWYHVKDDFVINGFSYDTRLLNKGEMFLALEGPSRSGFSFLAEAFKKGASAALVNKVDTNLPFPQLKVVDVLSSFQLIGTYHRRRFLGKVIGVTGSCGKTTTKDLLAHLIYWGAHKTHENLNNTLGVPLTVLGLENKRHDYGVIEAGMNQRNEMAQMAPIIAPDLAIITKIAPVHCEGVGDLESIACEKAQLLSALQPNGIALLNPSCLSYLSFKPYLDKAYVVGRDIQFEIKQDVNNKFNLSLEILPKKRKYLYEGLPFFSLGTFENIAIALAACHFLGFDKDTLHERLLCWKPSKYRGEIIQIGAQQVYLDCYNANPIAMKDAFAYFDKRFEGSLARLYILGCMEELGNLSLNYHFEVGNALRLKEKDKVFLIGAQANSFKEGILSTGAKKEQIEIVSNREFIKTYLKQFKGNVFIKGSKVYKLWDLVKF